MRFFKKIIGTLIFVLLAGCGTTPLDTARQLVDRSEYAGALELLKAEDFDTTSRDNLSLRAVACFVENQMAEGFADIKRIEGLDTESRFHAAATLMRAASIMSREKYRTSDVITLLDSTATIDPSLGTDVVNLCWQRGLEYLNSSGEAGWRYINCCANYDSNTMARLRAHDIILSRRYEELERMRNALPQYTEYGRKFFASFGKFPANLLEIQAAFPEAGLKVRSGWDISLGGNQGQIVAMATVRLDNSFGIKRGTVLIDEID